MKILKEKKRGVMKKCKCGNDEFRVNAVQTIDGRAWIDSEYNLLEFKEDNSSTEFQGDAVCTKCGLIAETFDWSEVWEEERYLYHACLNKSGDFDGLPGQDISKNLSDCPEAAIQKYIVDGWLKKVGSGLVLTIEGYNGC